MTVYVNQNPNASIASIEHAMVGSDHLSFVRVRANANADSVCQLLTSAAAQQTVLSRTTKEDGTLIVTKGMLEPEALRAALATGGETLAPPPPEPKKFNPWAWRGYMSIVGQSLQIAASLNSKGSAADRVALFGFASLNLLANFINIIFGAQKKHDKHQLQHLKSAFNEQLKTEGVASGLPSPEDNRMALRPAQKMTSGQRTYAFLQKHSVSFGEVGLRTIGTVSLIFPVTRLGGAYKALRSGGSLQSAYKAAVNPNPGTFTYGLFMMAGKVLGFAATERDPYNPKPLSAWRSFRERTAFTASSIVEAMGASYQTYDRFANQKIMLGGKLRPDIYGGTGSAVFVAGYGFRLSAPYGSLEVDMPELYAHISDGLAKLPPDKIQARLAETSEWLADHFKEKKIEVSKIYEGIAHELTKHHRIRLAAPEVANQPSSSAAPMVSPPAAQVTHADRQGCMVSGAEPLKQAGM